MPVLEEIISNNKKIALFMGAKRMGESSIPKNPNEIWIPVHGLVRADSLDSCAGRIMRYHFDWDWLIPVAGKILMHNHEAKINPNSIDETYKNVMEFIDWLNSVKK